jgi:uncharacterized integral membrane protein (TIGR00698 family)
MPRKGRIGYHRSLLKRTLNDDLWGNQVEQPPTQSWYRHEDFVAMILGAMILTVAWWGVRVSHGEAKPVIANAWKGWVAKSETWKSNPLDAFITKKEGAAALANHRAFGSSYLILLALLIPAGMLRGQRPLPVLLGLMGLLALATLAFVLASQSVIKQYNFEYVLWALLVGLLIANTVGVPRWLEPALHGELLIKMGLILLGAEILVSKLLELGLAGVLTSWIVTPIVLISTFWFGQKVLRMPSPSLNMVISADMSVCGVSAAIATGAACEAKREEISYAIGVSLFFTAIMMVVQPKLIQAIGMDPIVGAAWIGGTIDSTGAVVAAGSILGKDAEKVATTIKMIQNILIGVVAFGVALYWSKRYGSTAVDVKAPWREIWRRFPKFVLGFAAASLVFSMASAWSPNHSLAVDAMIKETTTPLRVWLFCLAFVAIGLQTDFRKLWSYLSGSKPLTLYLIGQAWNLLLSLVFCYVVFGLLFGDKFTSQGP